MFYYICAIVTLISSAVSFGFSIEAYIKSKVQNETALTNAKYAMSRSFSLFIVAIGLFIFMSIPYLVALSVAMIGVQLFDSFVGIKISKFKTFGPLLTAIGNTVVLVFLLGNR